MREKRNGCCALAQYYANDFMRNAQKKEGSEKRVNREKMYI